MPGKELVPRPATYTPVLSAVPPFPERKTVTSESGIVRVAKWTRRKSHATIPLAAPFALWLAALILHIAHPAPYVVPLCGAILSACVYFFAPHKWDRKPERWYARLSVILAALWLCLASAIGPLDGMTLSVIFASVLVAGTWTWGFFWWQHHRPRGMRKRQKLIAQCDAWWLSHCHNWDLHGSCVMDAKLSGVILTMRVQGIAGKHTYQHFVEAVPRIESAAEGHADIGLVRVAKVKGHPSQCDVILKQENPLREDVEYDMSIAPQSVHDAAPFGRTESGSWKMIVLRRNRFTIGATRTGKSNDLLVGIANLSGCPDARSVLIDLKGGRSARPVLESGAAEYVITEVDEARMYLRMSVAEILARAKNAYDGNEQLMATDDVPAVITLVDETHGLTSTMNGDGECTRLLATGASQGSGLEWYVWVYTQFGSLEESVGTEQTRGNLPLRTCYRVEEARHGAYVIPEYSKLDASKLEEQGTCYVKDGPQVLPEQVRAPKMPHELLARIAGQNTRLLGPRPPLRLYCGDQVAYRTADGDVTWQQWWDARWLRLDPAFHSISPQYQTAVAAFGGEVAAAATVTDVAATDAGRASQPVPSPVPGTGDAGASAARLAADDADLMSRVPEDFRPDPAMVARLPAAMASQEDRFADALEASATDSPVTPKELKEISGFGNSWIHDRIAALTEIGQVTQVSRGRYAALPGADIRAGLQAIKERQAALGREAQQKVNAA
jgi:hypothetical protein